MKRKGIIYCLIGIICLVLIIRVSFLSKHKIVFQDGIIFAVSVDGTSVNSFPSSGTYYANIECNNGIGKYSYNTDTNSFKVSVENFSGNTSCYVDFYSNPDTLIEVVETEAVNETVVTKTSNETTCSTTGDGVGYRYEGKNPNNYIWFNNEYWRIIGSIPTKASSSGSETNMVKIIRNDSIGSLLWNVSIPAPAWNQSSLYHILNSYYYGSDGSRNGTNDSHCGDGNCNFESIGIKPNGYYGRMIANVYWNTGATDYLSTPKNAYTSEKATQTSVGHIGIMSASDYGYGSSNHSGSLSTYSNVTSDNWLYENRLEWLLNAVSSNNNHYQDDALRIMEGNVRNCTSLLIYVNHPLEVRPVVYLYPSVYVINGNGTIETPYQIAMD